MNNVRQLTLLALSVAAAGLIAACESMPNLGLKPAAQGDAAVDQKAAQQGSAPAQPEAQSKTAAKKSGSPAEDKYCDSLETSYSIGSNLGGMMMEVAGSKSLLGKLTGQKTNLDDEVKEISKKYLWLPVPIEQSIGNQLHAKFMAKNQVVERDSKNDRELYEKAERALAAAKHSYTTMPYEIKLSIVEGDALNAEALPGGYILVQKRAVEELEESALQLAIGHELAHVAKRHLSMQLQQRIVDIGMGKQVFEKVMQGSGPNELAQLFQGEHALQKFANKFASYVRDQELQADACAIREMVHTEQDPVKAREEYVAARGEFKGAAQPSVVKDFLKLDFTEHPDDATRDAFFKEAAEHHSKTKPKQAQN